MDVARLRLSIPTVRLAPDGGSHAYDIHIVYGKLHWTVSHRFSTFLAVADALAHQGYEALPLPPPKTLTRPQDAAVLEGRRVMLQTWLRALCVRPDTRTSRPLLDFLEFELQTSTAVPSLAPAVLGWCGEPRFLTSDCVYVGSRNAIIAAYEESAHMSRLGKVWSLIEQDELGAIDIWHIASFSQPSSFSTPSMPMDPSGGDEAVIVHIAHAMSPFRVRCVYYHAPTGRIFCGLETGTIKVFTIGQASAEDNNTSKPDGLPLVLCPLTDLSLHSEAVLALRGDGDRLASVGYDGALRVVHCTSLETICGGRLHKRLTAGEHLTTVVIEPAAAGDGGALQQRPAFCGRLIVGSDKGRVFIFNGRANPPPFLACLDCDGPITALDIAGSNLLVAHKYALTIFRLSKDPLDGTAIRDAVLSPGLTSGRTIRSIALSRAAPLLFLGHTRAVSVWDCITRTCVTVMKAHYNGIRRIHVLETAPNDPAGPTGVTTSCIRLLTAGGDGLMKLWALGPAEEYVPWIVPDSDIAATGPPKSQQSPVSSSAQTPTTIPPSVVPRKNGTSVFHHEQKKKFQDDEDEDDCLISATSAVPHRH